MKSALQCAAVWLAAALVCVLIGMSWALDGTPSETDAAKATALNLQDAIATAQRTARKGEQ